MQPFYHAHAASSSLGTDLTVVSRHAERTFSAGEKAALIIVAIGLFVPVYLPQDRFILPELGMFVFLLSTKRLLVAVPKLYLYLLALLVPFLVEPLFPTAYFPLRRNVLICAKLTLFALFLFVFVSRCRHPANALWTCRRLVLPLSVVMAASFLIDQATLSTFFPAWHETLTRASGSPDRAIDDLSLDQAVGNGFSTRISDVPPWCFMGIASAIWLGAAGRIRRAHMVLLLVFFGFSMLVVPKRSALVVLALATIAFTFMSHRPMRSRMTLLIAVTLAISFAGAQVFVNHLLAEGVIRGRSVAGAYNRLLDQGLSGGDREYDDRIVRGQAQVEYLIERPKHLFFGAGWDSASSVWIKPHSTFLALLFGGGIWGTLVVLAGYGTLFRYYRGSTTALPASRAYAYSLAALALYNVVDSSFFLALEYPASLCVVWMAWTVILSRAPVAILQRTRTDAQQEPAREFGSLLAPSRVG